MKLWASVAAILHGSESVKFNIILTVIWMRFKPSSRDMLWLYLARRIILIVWRLWSLNVKRNFIEKVSVCWENDNIVILYTCSKCYIQESMYTKLINPLHQEPHPNNARKGLQEYFMTPNIIQRGLTNWRTYSTTTWRLELHSYIEFSLLFHIYIW